MKTPSDFWQVMRCGCRSAVHSRLLRSLGKLLFPLMSAAALAWFLVRVIPKPIRATYPCQRAAFPLASALFIWLLGLKSGLVAWLNFSGRLEKIRVSRVAIGAVCFLALAAVAASQLAKNSGGSTGPLGLWEPTDPPNSPMGVGKGIYPGRVVWAYNPALAKWNGSANYWWQDTYTDPNVAQTMMSRAIRGVAGLPDQAQAWDAIFRHFNRTHSGEDVGYQPGEKIAIKVNNIFSRYYAWDTNQKNRPSPQMVFALVSQLVNEAGVADTNITVYDCIFYHGDPVYNAVHSVFPGVRFAEGDATDRYPAGPGTNSVTREKVVADENPNVRVYYGNTNLVMESGLIKLPTVVTEAKYLINIALPRWHELAGVTVCAKNFFGSVWSPSAPYYHGWNPSFQHNAVTTNLPMGSYNALVDLMGHEHLGGKTMLFLVECIYQYYTWNLSTPPFTGNWVSSLWASQDPVAIDSVMVDFLRSFETGRTFVGSVDNYLHEAAQATNPPSHTLYDPEHDGTPLQSLGVHEHWNNATNKQYSRNLSTNGAGIELVAMHAIPLMTVALTSPTNGTKTCPGADLTLQAAVTTNYTRPQKVDFYRTGTRLGTSTNEPFSFVWSGVPVGNWALTAVATDGDNYSVTSAVVNVNASITNLIVAQPASRTNYVGTMATFSVTPNDCCQATAQWYHGYELLSGGTNFMLNLPQVQLSDAGDYTVTLSSGGNNVTSAPAALVVLSVPWLEIASAGLGDGSVQIVWPAEATAFSLFTATNLRPPVEWRLATNTPVLTNGQWTVRLPLTNGAVRFYRLQIN